MCIRDSICRQIGFSKIHMFPFSPRRTTPAAEMDNQIPGNIKSKRGAIVKQLETELRADYYQKLVGEPLQLLVEKVSEGFDRNAAVGTSCRYGQVEIDAEGVSDNDLVDVVVSEARADRMIGKQVQS